MVKTPLKEKMERGEVRKWWTNFNHYGAGMLHNAKEQIDFESLTVVEVNELFAKFLNNRRPTIYMKTSGNEYDKVMWSGAVARPNYRWFTEDLNAFHLLEESLNPEEKKEYVEKLSEIFGNENLIFIELEDRIKPLFDVVSSKMKPKEVTDSMLEGVMAMNPLDNEYGLISTEVHLNAPPKEEQISLTNFSSSAKDSPSFREKDTVEWTSQAGGFSKTKKGIIVKVVAPNENIKGIRYFHGDRYFQLRDVGKSRKHESYVVFVEDQRELYWPLVSKLRLVQK